MIARARARAANVIGAEPDSLAVASRKSAGFGASGRRVEWHVLCSGQRSPMRVSWRVLVSSAILAAACLAADGCMIRTYPIPPPSAERSSALTCAPPLCPNGGVTYVLEGNAVSGALVVAENVSRAHLDGHRYVASAWATIAMVSDAGADAGVVNGGHFRIVLAPEPQPDGSTTVCQPGDSITVLQFVRNSDGFYQASGALMQTVPAP